MRIAINTRFLLPGKLEGIGWHNYEICRRLVAAHPEDEFLFLFDRPFNQQYIFGKNVKGVVVPPPARHPILWNLWFERSVPAALRRWKADVFLSMDGYCSLRTKVPTVMVTHDIAHEHFPEQIPWLVRRYYQHYVPRFIQRAERVLTVSDFVRQDVLAHYAVAPEKIQTVHNGRRLGFVPLDEAARQQARATYANGAPYFFYLGAVHPRKNIDRLIRAFDSFKERTASPVKLLIGGRLAWQTDAMQKAWDSARHKTDIELLGFIPENELPQVLGGALALTYVSLFEGFGLPILEAMDAGIPVITSQAASMPEVAGDAALLVDPTDETSIAQAMEELFTHPELRQQLITAGKEQKERFSWDQAAEDVYGALKTILLKTRP